MKLRIVKALPEHAALLDAVAREEDRRECAAYAGETVGEALARSLKSATVAWSAFDGREIVACWGVSPISVLRSIGGVWLLTGTGVERHRKAFLRGSRLFLDEMLKIYDLLVAMVDASYDRAVRWARSIGFDLDGPRAYAGMDGEFYFATKRGGQWQ